MYTYSHAATIERRQNDKQGLALPAPKDIYDIK